MPRFYFAVRDGSETVPDPEGSELADLDAALFEARLTARDLLLNRLKTCEVIDGQEIEISDESGKVLRILKVRDVLKF